ncbi:acyl-CoA N-acyltransferase [Hyaloraphidium curvatum]|nr:acyl-CoA N-acyltransferase [Hyaloraphidium curvatum]
MPGHIASDRDHMLEFARHAAEVSKAKSAGHVSLSHGVEGNWAAAPYFMTNSFMTTRPLSNDQFAQACAEVTADAAKRQEALGSAFRARWLFQVFEGDLQDADAAVEIAMKNGLALTSRSRIMATDVSLLVPPAHPAPEMERRRIVTEADAAEAVALNYAAYGAPAAPRDAELTAASGMYRSSPTTDFGWLAVVDGKPVATCQILVQDGWLYVTEVATDPSPAHRGKGYAEHLLRHALLTARAETGLTRTALDASQPGAPIYARMGYAFTGGCWMAFVAARSEKGREATRKDEVQAEEEYRKRMKRIGRL